MTGRRELTGGELDDALARMDEELLAFIRREAKAAPELVVRPAAPQEDGEEER